VLDSEYERDEVACEVDAIVRETEKNMVYKISRGVVLHT